MRPRPGFPVVLAILIVSVLLGLPAGAASVPGPSPTSTALQRFDSHIDHIIVLMQENHAYDSLFGTYCLVTGTYCPMAGNGLPSGTCLPQIPYANLAKPTCLRPFNFTRQQMTIPDMEHDWYSTHVAYALGTMDGFWPAEGDTVNTMGHYNGSTVPVLWDTAEEYALGDDFFSSDASYSLPNHWGLVASTPPAASQLNYIGYAPVAVNHAYLNQSNGTRSVESSLLNSTVSWKFYDFALPSYKTAINFFSIGSGSAYDYWNPLAAQARSYTSPARSHFVDRSGFFSDAASGTLPNVSWVIPDPTTSDHPGSNLSDGENWTASVINALEASPDWNSTVLFVTWDEYGGFYDQVAPPTRDAVGDGFRVPLLAVGPYVRQGYIDGNPMDFNTLLRLVEVRFHLPCIGARDCGAKILPLDLFNFNRPPRAPIAIPYWGNDTYPLAPQSSGRLPPLDPSALPPPTTRDPTAGVDFTDPS